MPSFSTVTTGDDIVSSNINQFAEALGGQANIPISLTGINDASNFALDVKNAGTNARTFRAQDSSGNSRLQAANTSTAYVQADPDGSGLSVVATLGHPQTLSSKTLTNSTVSLLAASSNALRIPYVQVRHGSSQGITNSSGIANVVALTWNTEDQDNDGMHSTVTTPTRLIPSRQGLWELGGNVEWVGNSSGWRLLGFRENGSTVFAPTMTNTVGASEPTRQSAHTMRVLSTSDYVELVVQQPSVGTLFIDAVGNTTPMFWMAYRGTT